MTGVQTCALPICSPIVNLEEYDVLSKNKCDRYEIELLVKYGLLGLCYILINKFADNFSFPKSFEAMVYRCNSQTLSSLCILPNNKVTFCGKLYSSDPDKIPYVADLNTNYINKKLVDNILSTLKVKPVCADCDYMLLCGGKCPLSVDKVCKDEIKNTQLLEDYICEALKIKFKL